MSEKTKDEIVIFSSDTVQTGKPFIDLDDPKVLKEFQEAGKRMNKIAGYPSLHPKYKGKKPDTPQNT
ncbi:MAG: hypothetical protein OIF36_03275 [Alphaproteobacteria bacterium]|nr:hypothetical protein [Alphaproteobacteria bacterium]